MWEWESKIEGSINCVRNLALRIAIMENVPIMENVKGEVGFIQNMLE